MSATITLTGTAGPGISVTTQVFSSITSFLIDADKNMITMFQGGTALPPIAVVSATTVTATKTGNLWTLTIS